MIPILKYILLTAVRDWLFLGLFIILILAFFVSSILSSTFLVENSETFMIYMSSSARIIFVLGIVLFVCFYIRRSFDNKEIDFILSKSISRNKVILSYLLGFILVFFLILIPVLVVLLINSIDLIGLFYWSISIILEVSIIINFSILSSFILRSAVSSILISLSFYILSRMMAFFVLTIQIPKSLSNVDSLYSVLELILKILSILTPRLDLFTKSDWLIYGVGEVNHLFIILLQSLIYILLLIFMSFYDFNNKQF